MTVGLSKKNFFSMQATESRFAGAECRTASAFPQNMREEGEIQKLKPFNRSVPQGLHKHHRK